MSFSGNWHTLLEAAEELSPDATLITPLSHTQFRITDTQEHRVIIEILDSDDSQPLQRDQFETLYRRVQDASGGFELDRLPPDAEPYAAVLTLHPQFEIDEDAGILVETDAPAATQVIDEAPAETDDRTEPDVSVYADALLLIDALEVTIRPVWTPWIGDPYRPLHAALGRATWRERPLERHRRQPP